MALYNKGRTGKYEPAYYGSNLGKYFCTRVDLQGKRKVVSFSIGLGYGQSTYHGTNYTGNTTGSPRTVQGAIWSSRPAIGSETGPTYLSNNTITANTLVAYGWMDTTSERATIELPIYTFTFDNAVFDHDVIYVGLYTTPQQSTDVVFSTSSSSDTQYERLRLDAVTVSGVAHKTWDTVTGSTRFGFTAFNCTDPYTAPSYSFNSISPTYGIWNETAFKPNYTISGGSGSIDWTRARIYNSSDTYLGQYDLNNKSKGTITGSFVLGSGYSDGTQYKTAIRFSDNTKEYETGKKAIYTYRTPKISGVSLNPSSFSGTGNTTLKWTTNGRRWGTDNEANFTTSYKFNTNGTSLNSTNNNPNSGDSNNATSEQSQTLTADIINSSFTAAQRSQEKITTTVTVTRKNPTSGKTASATSGNVTIQFWPKYEISTLSYTDPNNNNTSISAGTTQYIDVLPKIRANWTYTTNADRGMIDGFIIRVYRQDQTTKVGNDYKVSASTTYLDFDTKTQLKRGELNYIKVIPYYNLPSGGVKEGPATIKQFILPLGRIRKPTISYPINNTIWHNKNFRILLQCPVDDDFDTYGITEANYRYKNIELYIEGPGFSTTYSYLNNATIFSTATMSYQKNIIINPSIITTFPNLTYYKFKIRFQKNYYQDTWSEWSDTIYIDNSAITELNITQGSKVLQTQYKSVRDYSVRLWNVYHKSSESYDSNNIAKSVGDIIYAINYQGIYNTILAIYNRVNGWATCDSNRSNVKFTQSITNMSNTLAPTKGELITASKVSNEPAGRNYKNILIECMNKLY